MKTFLVLSFTCFSLLLNAQKAANTLQIHDNLVQELKPELAPFYHGVASGDPTENAVIIWTKLTLGKGMNKPVELNYVVSKKSDCTDPIKEGTTNCSSVNNYTAKVDVQGLEAGTQYYYQFSFEGNKSKVGRTKTLPKNGPISIAFAACSNYEWGFFNNYRFIAEDPEIDLVVHLGDYIYEYAPGGYGDTMLGRKHLPAKEIITLDDYRTRYSQYRLDPDLMKAHQYKAFITTWDDHESANNSYIGGAQNHQENEGDWYERKKAAKKAYYEWMPVREPAYHELYRSFRIGDLANLIMLDTRIAGRTQQVDSITDPHYMDQDRTILGQQQFNWLDQQLHANAGWNIIGNQVPFGPMYVDSTKNGRKPYLDGWDGYPAERKRVIELIRSQGKSNTVWVTGDFHSSFALENDLTGTAGSPDNVSVEFVVTSISSANNNEYEKNPNKLEAISRKYQENNPHIKYLNQEDHGYMVLTISSEEVVAKFYYAESIRTRTASKDLEKTFVVKKGSKVLLER